MIKRLPKTRAFTLVEVLIACGIMVVVLGATVAANRIIRNNANLAEDRAIMGGIADEVINAAWTASQNNTLAGFFFSNVSGNQNLWGSIYSTNTPAGLNCYGGRLCQNPSESLNGPTKILWCNSGNMAAPNNCSAAAIDTKIKIGGTTDGILQNVLTEVQAKTINGTGQPGVVVAVKKSDGGSSKIIGPFTRYYPSALLDADSLADRKEYAFYIVRSNIVRDGSNYTLKVEVVNYYDQSSSITKDQTWTE